MGTGQCHMGVLQMSKQVGKNVKKGRKSDVERKMESKKVKFMLGGLGWGAVLQIQTLLIRIRILLFTLTRIRIMLFNLMRMRIRLFDTDPYPYRFKEVMYLKQYFLYILT